MTHAELAKAIYETAHLTGEFKLRSGQVSKEYFDKYRFEARPQLLREIARHMAPLIPAGTQALAGLEMGGIPIATALSLETGLPCVFVRKEAKEYGTCQFAEGLDIKGLRLCVVEDVITTGGQVVISSEDLRRAGARVEDVLCVIHRGSGHEPKLAEKGLHMKPLMTMDDLKAHL
ncbi:MAG: orotate phosphoribosyltransferase [Bdellovibrionaceae bacterium]|nr:orotate phosphoribosyltransferase [Pseudobdellovibrionaceae bacterium]MBX3034466.1 orotate phosphoribosyltransferase [Pseudobdellovibrionaceae bacterium]